MYFSSYLCLWLPRRVVDFEILLIKWIPIIYITEQSAKETVQRNETGKRVVKSRNQKKVEDSADESKEDVDAKNDIITYWDSQHSIDGDEKEETKDDDEEENETVETSKNAASKNGGTTEKKVEQKDELKTLINDWGDDDEDNF